MDNGNHQFDKAVGRFKQHSPLPELNGEFENKVFAKIKKKKNQRKIAVSVSLGLVIFAFIFTAQAVLFHRETKPMLAESTTVKEEVPVMEDVIFASSDSNATYAIEQVAYYGDKDTI